MSDDFERVYYFGTDNTTIAVISRTLKQLPEDIASWAILHCAFASVGGEIRGTELRLIDLDDQVEHVIVLDEDAMQTADAMYVVAHELAHARLDHATYLASNEYEDAADALAAEWGFSRTGGELMLDYKTGIRPRLRRAAGHVRVNPGSSYYLEAALQAIGVFTLDQFPADFRKQYSEILAAGTRNHTMSFPEAVPMMSQDERVALGKKIEQLFVDVCEPADLNPPKTES